MTAEEEKIIQMIRETGRKVVPPGGQVWLYGSRARGDAHEGSDWDILILLNKPKLEASDYDITYPFWELGWKVNAMIHPTVYTMNDWKTKSSPIFKTNVESEGMVVC